MDITSIHTPPTTPNPWTRKRKRSNSSVSLTDGIKAPDCTPTTSPKIISPQPQIQRLSTPPLIRDETPPSSLASVEQINPNEHSSPARKVVHSDSDLGCTSPRTTVARRLATMNLSKEEPTSKSEFEESAEISSSDNLHATSEPMSRMSLSDKPTQTGGPQWTSDTKTRPDFQRSSSPKQPPKKRLPPARGIKSPPPPEAIHFDLPSSSDPGPTTTSSKSLGPGPTADNWFDLSALTWKDSEITGHLMLDPEDDGEGINGIGFRPTPSMANDRSRRRKQQLTAWRTREEREERERRAEKRRQGRALYADEGPIPSLDLTAITRSLDKKSVRFAV